MLMKLFLTCDVDWQSRVDKVRSALSDLGLEDYFAGRDYGAGLLEIDVVLVCIAPELISKPRNRMSKKDRRIQMDVLLDLATMIDADASTRQCIVARRLIEEMSSILRKYSIPDFDSERFVDDLVQWVTKENWI